MTWSSALRSVRAAARQHEREARRQQREYEREAGRAEKENQKQQARIEAADEVSAFENRIKVLTSTHKECGPVVDWQAVCNEQEPPQPRRSNSRTAEAHAARHSFRPGFITKLFGRTNVHLARLDAAIQAAESGDEQEYQEALAEHANDMKLWHTEIKLANGVLSGDLAAFEKVVAIMDTFEELASFGTTVGVETSLSHPDAMSVELTVSESDIVPGEVKTLTKTGKLSTRAMPKGRSFEIYQDYVCGAVLRAARELLALLPIRVVVVTAMTRLFNSATGHYEDVPIVTAVIPKQIADSLNFKALDPSDAMANFPSRMLFKKTEGFAPVEQMRWDDIPVIVQSS
jgi:hypothetical protein